ncbi:MAG: hypothetical protein ACLPYZ_10435 [Limisphaerales bacterium]
MKVSILHPNIELFATVMMIVASNCLLGTKCVAAPHVTRVVLHVYFKSADLGETNQMAGREISAQQYLGHRFRVRETVQVKAVGGHFAFSSSFFAAIVRLPNMSSFPKGAPFTSDELVAYTVCSIGSDPSQDYVFPLSVTLRPGYYALVFGAGLYGTGFYGPVMPGNNIGVIRPSYIQWNGSQWEDPGIYGVNPYRFVVYDTINEVVR